MGGWLTFLGLLMILIGAYFLFIILLIGLVMLYVGFRNLMVNCSTLITTKLLHLVLNYIMKSVVVVLVVVVVVQTFKYM